MKLQFTTSNRLLFVYSIILEIIIMLLILLFVYTAGSKLLSFETFKIQLAKSPLLTAFAEPLAWVVPALELLLALLLIIKRIRLLALYVALFLLILFTTYLIAILNFSYYIPCSCGGVLERLSWNDHIIFNLVFIFLASVGIYIRTKLKGGTTQET